MSDLLQIGRSGVLAYQGAIAAVSENVTNADTDGYSRRQVVLREQSSAAGAAQIYRTSASFGGVQATEVNRIWDQYRAANAWSANSDAGAASTRSQYLGTVESLLGDGDSDVGAKLSAVFSNAITLAGNPGDMTLRQTMLASIGTAAQAMGQTASDLGKVSATIANEATITVGQVNDALSALGKLNVALHGSPMGSAGRAQLEDRRDSLIQTLSGAIGVDVTLERDGSASLRLDGFNGPQLLAADRVVPAQLGLQAAADGRLALRVVDGTGSQPVTLTGGKLAGLVDVAANVAGRRQQIDDAANQFVSDLTKWQAQGRTAAGAPGVPLLTGTSATTLALATTDPKAIAASDGISDNGNLNELSKLRGDTGLEATWRAMTTDQSLMVASSKTQASAAASRKNDAFSSLDEVSGVDLDAEAADLMRYQQAYTASAKIIQAARDTLQSIFQLF